MVVFFFVVGDSIMEVFNWQAFLGGTRPASYSRIM